MYGEVPLMPKYGTHTKTGIIENIAAANDIARIKTVLLRIPPADKNLDMSIILP